MSKEHLGNIPSKSGGSTLKFGRDIVIAKKVLSPTSAMDTSAAEVNKEVMFVTKMDTNTPMLLPHVPPNAHGLGGLPITQVNGIDGTHGRAQFHLRGGAMTVLAAKKMTLRRMKILERDF